MDNAVLTYWWMAGGTDIPGGTGSTYNLMEDDAGRTIQVRVTSTDYVGNEETLTGAATDMVAPASPPLTIRLRGAAPARPTTDPRSSARSSR